MKTLKRSLSVNLGFISVWCPHLPSLCLVLSHSQASTATSSSLWERLGSGLSLAFIFNPFTYLVWQLFLEFPKALLLDPFILLPYIYALCLAYVYLKSLPISQRGNRYCRKRRPKGVVYLASRWLWSTWHSDMGLKQQSWGGDTLSPAAGCFAFCWSFLSLHCWTWPLQRPWLAFLVTVEDFDHDELVLIMTCWIVYIFCLLHTSLACLPTPSRYGFFFVTKAEHVSISWDFI